MVIHTRLNGPPQDTPDVPARHRLPERGERDHYVRRQAHRRLAEQNVSGAALAEDGSSIAASARAHQATRG